MALQTRIELTRAHPTLADPAGARTLMREIDELLKRRPRLGTLAGEAVALPMLATHLSFPEIAAEMFL